MQDGRTLRGYNRMTADRVTLDAPIRLGLIIFDCDGVLIAMAATHRAEQLC